MRVPTLEEVLRQVEETKVFVFDVEHDPEKEFSKPDFELWGVGIGTGLDFWYVTDLELAKKILQTVFVRTRNPDLPAIEVVAYNGKYDLKCVVAMKWITPEEYPEHICDPMVGMNLLDDNRRPNQLGLKIVVLELYKHQMMEFKEASADGKNTLKFRKYALDDVYWEWKLWMDMKPKLERQGLLNLFKKILMPVVKVFADMELAGIKWDVSTARELLVGFMTARDKLQYEIFADIGPINLNSGDQLAKRLFDELGYSTRGIEMTGSGKRFAVDAEAMETLAKAYPVCDKIVKYRNCSKMIGTYIEPLTRLALDDPNGRIHPTVWIVSTTGRTRMEKPNFQNIPSFLSDDFKHLSIRRCVVARPGYKLLVADLSQIELRICAHVAQDPLFLAAYRDWTCTNCDSKGTDESQILHACPKCGCKENEDILKYCPKCKRLHIKADKKTGDCAVCRGEKTEEEAKIKGFWHGLDLHRMTADGISALAGDRQLGKQCNFALIYCATGKRMHYEHPSLSIDEWDTIIEGFMRKYIGIRKWHIQMESGMKSMGVCTDVFGRKRRISKKDIHMNYKHALNMFVNFPIQSSACAYIELCQVKMREHFLKDGSWMSTIFPINFVHDEVCFEVESNKAEELKTTVQYYLENSVQFKVPIRADVKLVDSWDKAKG